MATISIIFTLLTALLHLYFWILEMFLWTKPIGLKIFKMSEEKARHSKVVAENQGVYNALLAIGLLISFFITDPQSSLTLRLYCLSYIVIVSLYGWYSLSFRVFLIQGLPPLIAILTLMENFS